MSKLKKFEEAHVKAMQHIDRVLDRESSDDRYSIVPLVKWMIESDANPYGYIPQRANWTRTSTGFSSLIYEMEHALYDDGDMEFISVNGEPRIVFAWRHDDHFEDLVLFDNEKHMKNDGGFDFNIEVLDIGPEEFVTLYTEYHNSFIIKAYIHTAAQHGIEFADKHYQEYAIWTANWKDKYADKIEQRKQFFNKAGVR